MKKIGIMSFSLIVLLLIWANKANGLTISPTKVNSPDSLTPGNYYGDIFGLNETGRSHKFILDKSGRNIFCLKEDIDYIEAGDYKKESKISGNNSIACAVTHAILDKGYLSVPSEEGTYYYMDFGGTRQIIKGYSQYIGDGNSYLSSDSIIAKNKDTLTITNYIQSEIWYIQNQKNSFQGGCNFTYEAGGKLLKITPFVDKYTYMDQQPLGIIGIEVEVIPQSTTVTVRKTVDKKVTDRNPVEGVMFDIYKGNANWNSSANKAQGGFFVRGRLTNSSGEAIFQDLTIGQTYTICEKSMTGGLVDYYNYPSDGNRCQTFVAGEKSTITFTNTAKPITYSLTIKKVDESNKPMSGVYFEVYNTNENGTKGNRICSGNTSSVTGTFTCKPLSKGADYIVTEYNTTKYSFDTCLEGCEKVSIADDTIDMLVNIGDSNKEIKVKNKRKCEGKLEVLTEKYKGKTNIPRSELVSLYQSERAINPEHNYNNLLYFSDPSCTHQDCRGSGEDDCLVFKYKRSSYQTLNILGMSIPMPTGRVFSENDWSCYSNTHLGTSKSSDKVITGFCGAVLSLDQSQEYSSLNINTVKSGQLYFKLNNPAVMKGYFKMDCYFPEEIKQTKITNGKLGDYIKEIPKLGETNLIIRGLEQERYTDEALLNRSIDLSQKGTTWFTKVFQLELDLPKVYTEYLTGMPRDTACSYCRFLGYGILSKFNSDGTIGEQMVFEYKDNGLEYTTSGTCYYESEPELTIDDKLQVEFRTITKSNPFVNSTGNERNTKTNWCKDGDCTFDNNAVRMYIYNRNDSKNSTCQGPIYTINLTSADIKRIRNDMKTRNLKYDSPTTLDSNEKSSYLAELGITKNKDLNTSCATEVPMKEPKKYKLTIENTPYATYTGSTIECTVKGNSCKVELPGYSDITVTHRNTAFNYPYGYEAGVVYDEGISGFAESEGSTKIKYNFGGIITLTEDKTLYPVAYYGYRVTFNESIYCKNTNMGRIEYKNNQDINITVWLAYNGEQITVNLPEIKDLPEGYKFVGWATDPNATKGQKGTALLSESKDYCAIITASTKYCDIDGKTYASSEFNSKCRLKCDVNGQYYNSKSDYNNNCTKYCDIDGKTYASSEFNSKCKKDCTVPSGSTSCVDKAFYADLCNKVNDRSINLSEMNERISNLKGVENTIKSSQYYKIVNDKVSENEALTAENNRLQKVNEDLEKANSELNANMPKNPALCTCIGTPRQTCANYCSFKTQIKSNEDTIKANNKTIKNNNKKITTNNKTITESMKKVAGEVCTGINFLWWKKKCEGDNLDAVLAPILDEYGLSNKSTSFYNCLSGK